MCRLFGLTSGTAAVQATFWLLDPPDSLQAQSHRNADGSGIGFFGPGGGPVLDKQPEPAYADEKFRREARRAWSTAFVSRGRVQIRAGESRAAGNRPAPVIAVRDTGIGIAPQHQERIFDRLYRVDEARDRSTGGSGLGLAIARRAGQSLGARIEVDSSPGGGSEFRLLLPPLSAG